MDAQQQEALEKVTVNLVYFVEFDFASGTVRVSNFNQNVTWNGSEWLGVGSLGAISEITETDGVESSPLNFRLNIANPSLLALSVGPVEEYRGRDAKMYMCPMDEQFRLIGTPEICWSGIMDMMSVGVDGDEGQIVLKCETSAYGLKRRPSLRLNSAQQRKRYPTDTGLDFQNGTISSPAVWLSRRFQLREQ